jgi:hypothetical protein
MLCGCLASRIIPRAGCGRSSTRKATLRRCHVTFCTLCFVPMMHSDRRALLLPRCSATWRYANETYGLCRAANIELQSCWGFDTMSRDMSRAAGCDQAHGRRSSRSRQSVDGPRSVRMGIACHVHALSRVMRLQVAARCASPRRNQPQED